MRPNAIRVVWLIAVGLAFLPVVPAIGAESPIVAFTSSVDGTADIQLLYRDGTISGPIEPTDLEPTTFAISPDGLKIAFVATATRCISTQCAEIASTLYSVNVDGSGLVPIFSAEEGMDFLVEPEWSPDGKTIMFVVMPSYDESGERPNSDVWASTQTAVGTWETAPLLARPGNEFSPEWSPDGGHIAYEYDPNPDGSYDYRGGDERAGRIWLSDADGSGPHVKLTKTIGFQSNPAFSSDGRWIAYVSAPTMWSVKGWDIRIMRVDGSNKRTLAEKRFESWGLHFRPDGREIVYGEGWGLDAGRLMTVQVRWPNRIEVLHDSESFDFYPEYFPAP